jgi:hypothetical protein
LIKKNTLPIVRAEIVDSISSFWFFFTTAVAFKGLTVSFFLAGGVVMITPIDDDDESSSIAEESFNKAESITMSTLLEDSSTVSTTFSIGSSASVFAARTVSSSLATGLSPFSLDKFDSTDLLSLGA